MSFASVVTAATPYAWYRCNDTAGTVLADSSGNSRPGSIVGPVTFSNPGYTNDGNHSIGIPINGPPYQNPAVVGTALNLTTAGPGVSASAFTLGFFWKPSTVSLSYVCGGQLGDANHNWQIIEDNSVNPALLRLVVTANSGSSANSTCTLSSIPIASYSSPILLWVTYDGSGNWAVIVDGSNYPIIAITSTAGSILAAVSGTLILSVGNFQGQIGLAAPGQYQDIMLFNSVVSNATRQGIFNASGVITNSFNTVVASLSPYAWYKLNESSGSTLVDSSGNSRNGTILGTPTYSQLGFTSDSGSSQSITPGTGYVLSGGPGLTNTAFTLGFFWAPRTLSIGFLACTSGGSGNTSGWQLTQSGSALDLFISNGTSFVLAASVSNAIAGSNANTGPQLYWLDYDGVGSWHLYQNGSNVPLFSVSGVPYIAPSSTPYFGVASQNNSATYAEAGYYQHIMQFSGVLPYASRAQVYAAAGVPLKAPTFNITADSISSVSMSWTAAQGGVYPYTYTVYRSLTPLLNQAGGTVIYTGSGLSFTDTPPDNQLYFYRVVASDSSTTPSVAQSAIYPGQMAPTFLFGGVGDSRMSGVNSTTGFDPFTQFQTIFSAFYTPCNVPFVNGAVSGAATSDWLPGQSYYTTFMSNLQTAAATLPSGSKVYIHLALGANDAYRVVSLATYLANLTTIITAIKAANVPYFAGIFLNQTFYAVPGAGSGGYTEAADQRIQSYNANLSSLVDNQTVFLGETQSYDFFAINAASYLVPLDGLHPGNIGYTGLASLWAKACLNVIPSSTGSKYPQSLPISRLANGLIKTTVPWTIPASGVPGSTGTAQVGTTNFTISTTAGSGATEICNLLDQMVSDGRAIIS